VKEVRVELGERSYIIRVQPGLLDKFAFLLPKASTAAIITDTNVGPLFAERVKYALTKVEHHQPGVIMIPAGDEHKNSETLAAVYDRMFELGLDRSSMVVALGGGVVGDVAGYAAATFMRGIRYVQLPTTLLADVDSSVGGKTGINHPRGKNMIGAFHQPSAVFIDPAALQTLPEREFAAGMAEVIKYGIIRDAEFFGFLEQHATELRGLQPDAIQHVIVRCCEIKADVVAADEREGGVRAILNYGHTIGHALEAITGYSFYRHGEAIAIGMNLAARIAGRMGMIGEDIVNRQARLLQEFGLPAEPGDVDKDRLVAVLRGDKKARAGRVRFVLPVEIGSVVVSEDVTDEMVKELF